MNQGQNFLYRQWCTNCQLFTIHEKVDSTETDHQKYQFCSFTDDKDYATICECNKQYESVNIQDIPLEKLIEQQERYISSTKNIVQEDIVAMTLASLGEQPEENQNVIIIETDAGYRQIKKQEFDREREKQLEAKRAFWQKYYTFYAKLGRNDKCGCGSGTKYKKCHLDEITDLKRIYT